MPDAEFEKQYQEAKARHDLQPLESELIRRANEGSTRFARSLGFAYLDGELPVDYEQSRYWSQRAVDQGSTMAITNLAVLYLYGEGVSADPKKAHSLLTQAASQGDFKALRYLGLCYQDGLGVKLDEKKAVAYFTKAAQASDITSMYYLGELYRQGLGVIQDYDKAFEWYQKAAARGDFIASSGMVGLAKLYEHGLGRATSMPKAKAWYQRAADVGNEQAIRALDRIRILESN